MLEFSVIIPCYNSAEVIRETIASLQAQSCKDWEAICVDDGSTDKTASVLLDIARQDPRIHVLTQKNAGPSAARNLAARHSKGQKLAFLDADDLWFPDKLENVSKAFQVTPRAIAVFGRIAFFRDTDGSDFTTSSVRPGPAMALDFMGENPSCTLSNLSVNRRAFLSSGGFDETLRYAEDLEWILRMICKGKTVIATNELHVRYRASESGLSADLEAMHSGWQAAVAPARSLLPKQLMARSEATHLRYLARRALRMKQPPLVAIDLASRGMRASPLGFLGGGYRGPLTFVGCLISPLLPSPIRHRIFA